MYVGYTGMCVLDLNGPNIFFWSYIWVLIDLWLNEIISVFGRLLKLEFIINFKNSNKIGKRGLPYCDWLCGNAGNFRAWALSELLPTFAFFFPRKAAFSFALTCLRCGIFGFFLLSFPRNERKIYLVCLSLYISWGKCVYFSIFEWWNSLLCQKIHLAL